MYVLPGALFSQFHISCMLSCMYQIHTELCEVGQYYTCMSKVSLKQGDINVLNNHYSTILMVNLFQIDSRFIAVNLVFSLSEMNYI